MRSKIEEYIVDSIAMLLALITIFIAYLNNMTLSYLVNTKWEPLFITMIATTSLSLFNIKSETTINFHIISCFFFGN
jgi:membrane-associated HD superfamily phosphohydrolase